jgi:hypothetical protein
MFSQSTRLNPFVLHNPIWANPGLMDLCELRGSAGRGRGAPWPRFASSFIAGIAPQPHSHAEEDIRVQDINSCSLNGRESFFEILTVGFDCLLTWVLFVVVSVVQGCAGAKVYAYKRTLRGVGLLPLISEAKFLPLTAL